MQPFGLSLQGHPRCIGFYASSASTGTLWTIKGHQDVAQLSCAEGTSMHQLILMDNPPSNTFKETNPCSNKSLLGHVKEVPKQLQYSDYPYLLLTGYF